MSESKCDRCEKTPIHPEKKCCFNCRRSGSDCDVWHTCGDGCPGWEKVDTVQPEIGTDYKELIEHLKNIRFLYADDGIQCESVCKEAATAIETMLAEREALLSEIKGECHFCAFEWGACVGCYDGSEWQWRGPTPPDRERTER